MSLAGKTVVLTRSPDRAKSLLEALSARGARGWLFPVIDFETPADTRPLEDALRALQQGKFDWLMITSVTTVRALAVRAAALSLDPPSMNQLSLNQLVLPGTRVAAVGPAVARVLEAEGIRVDLVPTGEQSARGLLQSWAALSAAATGIPAAADSSPAVFLPQADIAYPTLREGLRELGAKVRVVEAYCTVNYPADSARRLFEPGFEDRAPIVLVPADFRREHGAGGVDALVLTSPSAARRVSTEAGRLADSVQVIAIGRPTAEEAAGLGLRVAAVAPEPTPAGIISALEQAFVDGGPPAD